MVLENVMNNLSGVVANRDENGRLRSLTGTLLGVLIFIVMLAGLMLFGEYLWNNFARRLVPALGKARWYDVFMLTILLRLMRI